MYCPVSYCKGVGVSLNFIFGQILPPISLCYVLFLLWFDLRKTKIKLMAENISPTTSKYHPTLNLWQISAQLCHSPSDFQPPPFIKTPALALKNYPGPSPLMDTYPSSTYSQACETVFSL